MRSLHGQVIAIVDRMYPENKACPMSTSQDVFPLEARKFIRRSAVGRKSWHVCIVERPMLMKPILTKGGLISKPVTTDRFIAYRCFV